MRSRSTPQDHHHWHLLAEASARQQRQEAMRADAALLFKSGSPAEKRWQKLMADFVALAKKCDVLDAEITRREEIMARRELRELQFAADAGEPTHDQPQSIDRIKDKGSDNGNGNDRLSRVLEAIEQRLSKLEGSAPAVLDEDEDDLPASERVEEIAKRAKTDVDPDDMPAPALVPRPGEKKAADSFVQRRNRCLEVQAMLDGTYTALGMSAPPPMAGEFAPAIPPPTFEPLEEVRSGLGQGRA